MRAFDILATWIWNPWLVFFYIQIGLLLTFSTSFVAWRLIRKAVHSLVQSWKDRRSKSSPQSYRHISQSRAFITALSASVGVGNIAGVSTAIHLGGPGALFWMWVSALLGMSLRMASVWLAMHFRDETLGTPRFATPMAYLERLSPDWRWVAKLVAVLILVKGFVTANLIQSNSVAHAFQNEFGGSHVIVATLMALVVATIVLGGMRRIVDFSVSITPFIIILYMLVGLFILFSDPEETLFQLRQVFQYAFTPYSVIGGVAGYTVLQSLQFGISRGIFSHGSGLGVEPFIQAANDGDLKQAVSLAALVPLVDTLIVCSITGLIVLSYGDWSQINGAFLTVSAYDAAIGSFGRNMIVLLLILFALTTIINWSYYAERCFEYLGGEKRQLLRWLFITVTFIGPFLSVKIVWYLADILIALLLISHLLPLLYLTLRYRFSMLKQLY